MSLSVSMDSSVCSMMRIQGFGEGSMGGYNRSAARYENTASCPDLQTFLMEFSRCRVYYDEHASYSSNRFENEGLVMAVVTDIQPKALKVLREFGPWTETSSEDMVKYKHEVHMLVMSVREFAKHFNAHNKRLKLGLPSIDVKAGK